MSGSLYLYLLQVPSPRFFILFVLSFYFILYCLLASCLFFNEKQKELGSDGRGGREELVVEEGKP